jgi:hypothetical protein
VALCLKVALRIISFFEEVSGLFVKDTCQVGVAIVLREHT